MIVNPTVPKEMKHLLCQLRFLDLEAGYVKKHEEFLKTDENLTKQLNEMKTKLVRVFNALKII